MPRGAPIIVAGCFILGVFAPFCVKSARAQTQQSNAPSFNQTHESSVAKARDECKTLWSDRAFDSLRSKVPLGEEKPTFSMLTNREKLRPKDKPLEGEALVFMRRLGSRVARFRRVNEDRKFVHHDALELPSGKVVLLTRLLVGQRATVLQLPVAEGEKEAERSQSLTAQVSLP
jgi:hypothetical protein